MDGILRMGKIDVEFYLCKTVIFCTNLDIIRYSRSFVLTLTNLTIRMKADILPYNRKRRNRVRIPAVALL